MNVMNYFNFNKCVYLDLLQNTTIHNCIILKISSLPLENFAALPSPLGKPISEFSLILCLQYPHMPVYKMVGWKYWIPVQSWAFWVQFFTSKCKLLHAGQLSGSPLASWYPWIHSAVLHLEYIMFLKCLLILLMKVCQHLWHGTD